MLKAIYHQNLKKDYKKLSHGIRRHFAERLELFLENQRAPLLNDHLLKRNLQGKRAFSVTGDVRVVYRYIDEKTVLLLRVGTHNQVY